MAAATFDLDCKDGATLVVSAVTATSSSISISSVDNPTPTTIFVSGDSSISFPCTGVYSLAWETTEIEWRDFTLPQFPYVQALLGLAGLICALLVVWAFNR
jgi:hypothetical protein